MATDLLNRFQPHSRAYGELLQADILAGEGRAVDAVDALRRGQKLADVWLGRLVLGAIFTEAGRAPEAISDLDLGAKRRGEASAAFLDDMPTFRYRALHLYWLARAQESVGLASAAEATRAELRDLAPALVGAATAVHPWLRLPGRATR